MIVNRDIATAAAEALALDHLNRAPRANPVSSKLLGESTIPIFGIHRPARIIRRVGRRKMNGILRLLRNSQISQHSYDRISQLLQEALGLDLASFHAEWGRWRSVIETFDMGENFPPPSLDSYDPTVFG